MYTSIALANLALWKQREYGANLAGDVVTLNSSASLVMVQEKYKYWR
jgi:hypothetical protein